MPSKQYISGLFNEIAHRYDLINNLLSVGLHWSWKKKLVSKILDENVSSVLDVATGTGDIISLIKEKLPEAKVLGIDLSKEMIEVAKNKHPNIDFKNIDVNEFKTDYKYDVSCISFGIRNVENIENALISMADATKKKIFILEFGTPQNKVFKATYFFMMEKFIPWIGKLFRFKDSYQYLIDSSKKFPSDDEFIRVATATKLFKKCSYQSVFGGICYIYELKL